MKGEQPLKDFCSQLESQHRASSYKVITLQSENERLREALKSGEESITWAMRNMSITEGSLRNQPGQYSYLTDRKKVILSALNETSAKYEVKFDGDPRDYLGK